MYVFMLKIKINFVLFLAFEHLKFCNNNNVLNATLLCNQVKTAPKILKKKQKKYRQLHYFLKNYMKLK